VSEKKRKEKTSTCSSVDPFAAYPRTALQAAEETAAMALISLPLVKIGGDAKADDDADAGATAARKPLNARLDRNIAPPFFSANLNSSSPLSTDRRTLFRIPTNSFSWQ
jgi:hypothetical protein